MPGESEVVMDRLDRNCRLERLPLLCGGPGAQRCIQWPLPTLAVISSLTKHHHRVLIGQFDLDSEHARNAGIRQLNPARMGCWRDKAPENSWCWQDALRETIRRGFKNGFREHDGSIACQEDRGLILIHIMDLAIPSQLICMHTHAFILRTCFHPPDSLELHIPSFSFAVSREFLVVAPTWTRLDKISDPWLPIGGGNHSLT
ncbi:hypothetical protein B0H14DRAFT_2614850 [Mycena olivaceomarginata]|nr:hypothetical protein B0H14DRAFT_2614850 [Mycena olivaceomarginata]